MKILYLFVFVMIASSCSEAENKSVSPKKTFPQIGEQEQKNQPEKPEGSCIVLNTVTNVEVTFLNSSTVRSEIPGIIEAIANEGIAFKKGDLLVQLDNRAAFDKLVSGKESFIQAVRDFSEKDVAKSAEWEYFPAQLDPYKLLPELPQIKNPGNEEKQLILQYEAVSKLERQMRDHFIIAQNDGIVLTQNYKAGDKVKSGTALLITGKSKQKAFRLPENYNRSGSATLVNEKTEKKYTVVTGLKKTWIEVETLVPVGKYTLNPVSN